MLKIDKQGTGEEMRQRVQLVAEELTDWSRQSGWILVGTDDGDVELVPIHRAEEGHYRVGRGVNGFVSLKWEGNAQLMAELDRRGEGPPKPTD